MRKINFYPKVYALVACMAVQTTLVIAQDMYTFASSNNVVKSHFKSAAYSDSDIKEQKQTLQSALMDLNKKKGVYFLLPDQSLGKVLVNPVVDFSVKTEQILLTMLRNTGLQYKKINEKTIVIQQIKDPEKTVEMVNGSSVVQLNLTEVKKEVSFFAVVKGTVSGSDGTPLPGASIIIKGSTKGAQTDQNGAFTINAQPGDVLVVSYIGYDSREITVGSNSKLSISLTAAKQNLSDVVVTTALGIQKKAKDLGYVAQQVSSAELTTVKEANFSNSLAGKAANVIISQGSGGAGSATNIILRGNNSLSGNGSPLIVIDGIPVVNTNARPTTGQGQYGQNFLAPDQLSTINPSDVEDVTILRGANAAALYGSQAANGAIVITTKSGKDGQTRVSVSTNTTFLNALYHPKLQNEYGGASGDNGSFSWGAKDPNAAQASGFYKDLLQGGLNSSNTIDLSTGTKNAQLFATYANTSSKGIIPNNTLTRNNFDLKGNASLFNKFIDFTGKFSYVDQTINNPYAPGQYLNPYYTLMTMPANTNLSTYSNRNTLVLNASPFQNWAYDPGSTNTDNPYWDMYKVLSSDNLNRLILSGSVKFNFSNYLNLIVRGNLDQSNEQFLNKMYQGTWTALASTTGGYSSNSTLTKQSYGDAILNYTKDIAKDWHLTALAGTAIRDYKQTGISLNSGRGGMFHPNVFTSSNIDFHNSGTINDIWDRKQIQSLFYSVEFGYKNAIFLTNTGRSDWSSTLPPGKNNYFYPSVGLSAVLTDLFKDLQSNTMNFLKLRASYTQVGNDLPTFIVNPVTTIGTNGALIVPNTAIQAGTILKPELTGSFETGFDVAFFNNLIKLEATYYQSNTKDQLFTVLGSGGFAFNYANGGNIQNKGIELTLSVTPNIGKVKWTSTVNYAKNVNTVKSLINGTNFLIYSQLNNSTSYFQKIVPGGSLGDFYAKKFQRNTDGSYKLSSYYINGSEQNGTTPLLDDQPEKIGNAFPAFLLSWGNKFTYKNFHLSFLVDGHFGGKVLSLTQAMLDNAGNSIQSASDRDKGYVIVNGQQATDVKGFYQLKGGMGGAMGEYAYSSTAVRLREVSLLYSLPKSMFDNGKFIKGASVGLVGRNLFFFYKAAPIDPEIVSNNAMGQNAFLGAELYNLPSTRNIGFSVNVNF